MGLFLGTLQIILDKGQDADWFSAVWLRWFAVICAASFIGFIVRELRTDHPIVDLRIFKNRNFAVSSALFALFGLALYALIALQPLFLQSLLGYTAFDAGLSVTPRGIGSLGRGLCGRRAREPGQSENAGGTWFRLAGARQLSVEPVGSANDHVQHHRAQSHRRFRLSPFIFVPLTTLAIGTLRNEQIGNATGLQNLVRNIGGSVGLSFVSTMLQRYSLRRIRP